MAHTLTLLLTHVEYIARQEEHHRRIGSAEEYVVLLRKHNVAYDERFVLG